MMLWRKLSLMDVWPHLVCRMLPLAKWLSQKYVNHLWCIVTSSLLLILALPTCYQDFLEPYTERRPQRTVWQGRYCSEENETRCDYALEQYIRATWRFTRASPSTWLSCHQGGPQSTLRCSTLSVQAFSRRVASFRVAFPDAECEFFLLQSCSGTYISHFFR
jgi:hypothetical protein